MRPQIDRRPLAVPVVKGEERDRGLDHCRLVAASTKPNIGIRFLSIRWADQLHWPGNRSAG
jgi:hypothetical protein